MGIQGLLPFINKAINKGGHLNDFKGKTVAVDAYVWIYKGSIKCATEIALNQEPRDYINYCNNKISQLQEKGITPLLVFDGCYLPSKQHTEAERKQRRELKREEGLQLFNAENEPDLYKKCFEASLEVTPQMAHNVIMECCVERGIEYIVAPYEADAQLAYLSKIGKADAVLTEDSDLICFGCHTVIYKVQNSGACHVFKQKKLFQIHNGK